MAELTPEQEEYRRKQKDRMNSLIVGAKDSVGAMISHVYARGDEYIVYDYENEDGSKVFRVCLDTEIEDDPKNMLGNLNKIKQKYNEFKAVSRKADNQEFAKSVAAQAISLGITGEIVEANKIFDDIIGKINKEHKQTIRCKMAYLLACMSWLILTSMFGILVYWLRQSNFLSNNTEFINSYFCALFAGFGGFISVSHKLLKLVIEKDVSCSVYMLYGIERMIIANLSGIVAYVLIRCGIALSFMNDVSNPLYAYMTVSILSGFSETYIPDLLLKMGAKEQGS